VLQALNPVHTLTFRAATAAASFHRARRVVLAVTGAEALYADMGHFGKAPVRLAWLAWWAALVLNYFGRARC